MRRPSGIWRATVRIRNHDEIRNTSFTTCPANVPYSFVYFKIVVLRQLWSAVTSRLVTYDFNCFVEGTILQYVCWYLIYYSSSSRWCPFWSEKCQSQEAPLRATTPSSMLIPSFFSFCSSACRRRASAFALPINRFFGAAVAGCS
jgi:hypothetical protein